MVSEVAVAEGALCPDGAYIVLANHFRVGWYLTRIILILLVRLVAALISLRRDC